MQMSGKAAKVQRKLWQTFRKPELLIKTILKIVTQFDSFDAKFRNEEWLQNNSLVYIPVGVLTSTVAMIQVL